MHQYATPLNAIYALWIFWWVTWHVAAFWAAKTTKRGFSSGIGYILLAIVGFALLLSLVPARYMGATTTLWSLQPRVAWAFVGLGAAGIAFMWWARLHLGQLWSGGIVLKEAHRVVDTGPYALVRHPIYTGLLLLAVATLAVKGDSFAVAGVLVLLVAYVGKARLEERFLTAEMGPAYEAYRKRVPMLVPFWPA
jgi:protein-S-isoprenylcysteine O-methyltransferase Ste14